MFDLDRFVVAQENVYDVALRELKAGRKRTHWMWFVFPQFKGLGRSSMSQLYSIKSKEEAELYLEHPILGQRLLECCEAVLSLEGGTIREIMGSPDDVKLKSSMTLFAYVSQPESIFVRVLDRYFQGKMDGKTIHALGGKI